MPQQTAETPATPEARKDPTWPYLAALAVALGVQPDLALINADAFVTKARLMAYLPNVQRRSQDKMMRELGRLLTSSFDEDFRLTIGRKALEAMKSPSSAPRKGLNEWVGRRIGINQRKLFDQAFSQLKKGRTDLLN